MALRIYLRQNENDKVGIPGNYYAYADNMPPIGIDELADLIKEHNVGFSRGSIVGILKDMVSIIRRQVLNGQPVKIDDLAIFKANVENHGGWSDLKDVVLSIGGKDDNIQAIHLVAQATGDFTKAELSKEARLVLDRQSQQMVSAAGKEIADDDSSSSDEVQDGSSDSSDSSSDGGGTSPGGNPDFGDQG